MAVSYAGTSCARRFDEIGQGGGVRRRFCSIFGLTDYNASRNAKTFNGRNADAVRSAIFNGVRAYVALTRFYRP